MSSFVIHPTDQLIPQYWEREYNEQYAKTLKHLAKLATKKLEERMGELDADISFKLVVIVKDKSLR